MTAAVNSQLLYCWFFGPLPRYEYEYEVRNTQHTRTIRWVQCIHRRAFGVWGLFRGLRTDSGCVRGYTGGRRGGTNTETGGERLAPVLSVRTPIPCVRSPPVPCIPEPAC